MSFISRVLLPFNCPFREIPPTPPDSLVYQLRQHGTHLMNDTLMGGLYQELQTSNEKKERRYLAICPPLLDKQTPVLCPAICMFSCWCLLYIYLDVSRLSSHDNNPRPAKKRKRRNFSVILFPPYLLGKKLREKKCLVFHPRIFSYHLSLSSLLTNQKTYIYIYYTHIALIILCTRRGEK